MKSTHLETESLEPLDILKYPNNQAWVVSRCMFLLSMKNDCPHYFFSPDGKTVDEMMELFKRSLSRELMDIRDHYPKVYAYAMKDLEVWLGSTDIPK